MSKARKRYCCFFLSVVMLAVLMPVSGHAVSEAEGQSSQTGIYEVTALREENVKHFALPDGSYEAVSYSQPVHERNAAGQWVDIDNNLQLASAKGNSVYTNSSRRVSFAQKLSQDRPLFSVQDGTHGISMTIMQGASLSAATKANTAVASVNNSSSRRSSFSTIEEATKLNSASTVTYADALPGVDLSYTVKGYNVKENIIVK